MEIQQKIRLNILGAPGAGVSSLAAALATKLRVPHFDTDDYHWIKDESGLQFRKKRNAEHRLTLLQQDLEKNPSWILSGSICGWGDVLIPQFSAFIFLDADWITRRNRIEQREIQRYGHSRIAEGGDLFVVYKKFLIWAERYGESGVEGQRTRERDWDWLLQTGKPLGRLQGELNPEELLIQAEKFILQTKST